jgi:hypothetical protein
VERRDQDQGEGFTRIGTPTQAAAALLSIFIAMYLAVAALLHLVSGPDAAASTTEQSATVVSATVSEPAGAIVVSQPPSARAARDQASSKRADVSTEPRSSARACKLRLVMDPEWIFDLEPECILD